MGNKHSNAIVSAIPNSEEKNIDKYILYLHNEFRKHIWNYENQSIINCVLNTDLTDRASKYAKFLAELKYSDEQKKNIQNFILTAGDPMWHNNPVLPPNTYRNNLCLKYLGAHTPIDPNSTKCLAQEGKEFTDKIINCVSSYTPKAADKTDDMVKIVESASSDPYYSQMGYSNNRKELTGNAGCSGAWPFPNCTDCDNQMIYSKWCPIAYVEKGVGIQDSQIVCSGLTSFRNVDNFMGVSGLTDGQNVGIEPCNSTKNKDVKKAIIAIFSRWANGINKCELETSSETCSHCMSQSIYNERDSCTGTCPNFFTQLVWKRVNSIGIGISFLYNKGKVSHLILICNYNSRPQVSDYWNLNIPRICSLPSKLNNWIPNCTTLACKSQTQSQLTDSNQTEYTSADEQQTINPDPSQVIAQQASMTTI